MHMSKKILILDIDKCIECPCLEKYEDWLGMVSSGKCRVNDQKIELINIYEHLPKCPLKDFPDKKEISNKEITVKDIQNYGYNQCIEYLESEVQ